MLISANLICSTSAQTPSTSTFTCEVILDSSVEQRIDLSDIKVNIYTLSIAYEDPFSHQKDYDSNYVQTLSLGKNGIVSFTKPSQYFKVAIELSTLPEGIGVNKYECKYENDTSGDTFTLYTVDRAELIMENALVVPEYIFYSKSGNRLYCNYNIQLTSSASPTVFSTGTNIFLAVLIVEKISVFQKVSI